MVHEMAPMRRQLGALGKMQRRKRIFARLREGASYEEIAAEEGVSRERIRQIVSEVLQKRSVDSGADHAKLQLDRLLPAMQLAAEGIAAGDVTAITPYLKVLDRLDRYQSVAGANQVYRPRRTYPAQPRCRRSCRGRRQAQRYPYPFLLLNRRRPYDAGRRGGPFHKTSRAR